MAKLINELTFANRDEFKRKAIATKVINLLLSDINVSPMVIDGGWGIGKTEFCHKLIALFEEEENHPEIIYIDAFKADHADEPLLTILAAVAELLPPAKQSKFIKKIIPTLKFGLKTSGKALIAHLLKQDSSDVLNDLDEVIQEIADKAIDASVEATLKDHIRADENLEALQNALRQIITPEKPVVVFIDELDRCRPDFAVNMLEVIKHTFAVKGLQFVLVTNTEQLKASVNHRYGSSIDANQYLNKFLKFKFSLTKEVNLEHINDLATMTHCQNLVDASKNLSDTNLLWGDSRELLELVVDVNSVSLREIEALVRNINIFQVLGDEEALSSRYNELIRLIQFFGILVFTFEPNLAESILSNRMNTDSFREFLGQDDPIQHTINFKKLSAAYLLLILINKEAKFRNNNFHVGGASDRTELDHLLLDKSNRTLGIESKLTYETLKKTIMIMSLCE